MARMMTGDGQLDSIRSRGYCDAPTIQKQIHFFLLAFRADSTARLVCFSLANSQLDPVKANTPYPSDMSWSTPMACVSTLTIVSSCCSTSIDISWNI